MTDTPTFFTVLTPTYNRAGTLHRVYESLSRQTFRDFEWVVVDDGSTDNTHESILAWQARADFPIRYIWQNNQHKKTAFNRGVREAQGQMIVALDSDDEMPPDALAIFKEAWDAIPPARRESYVAITGLCARPDGSIVGDRYPQDVFDSTAVDVYFRYRIKGEKFGCMRTDVLRKYPFPEDVAGFVPESLVWWAVARAGYLSRFINRVVRTYHDTPGGLSQGAVSVGSNAQGLYLLAWDMLQHHLEFFRYRPREFIMAAARYTRFRLHLKHSGVPTAVGAYRLTNPMATFMVAAMWPLGYALYRRDRRRGVA
ncbi:MULTISPECIES: glycosyltransferase family 2 protein [Achromobacter]|uniref:Glycosyl transferase n=1 Tax=Achromobacter spanius TaxID=217203 RepID=A0AAW3HZE3_9BURK|nr:MULTISPECIES: glycosyltransferase family A protein [Achromobacter]AZS77915.1 glycosyltransferase family 2 protein [Achromobacter spanius]KNE25601.1 glycosyl transferase [Achromobacter spanius]MCD0495334.1 glycosyltransferase family 2 protein [Achromobacter sp. MY14]MCW3152262.1 glycosyltransferase family 2 protein [Achromobacter spanius]